MNKFKTALAAAGLALVTSGASAAIVNLEGDTVWFSFDTDHTNPLFGSYRVVGDTLSFSPNSFVAETGHSGIVNKSATTDLISVTSKSGYVLSELTLLEQGDYYRVEETANNTSVRVSGLFIVNDVEESIHTINPLNVAISTDDYFDPDYEFETTTWNAESFADAGWAETATVKVQNILNASVRTDTGVNYAFIEKKLMNISAWTAPVPVPGAFWLFGSALTGILVSRRRTA